MSRPPVWNLPNKPLNPAKSTSQVMAPQVLTTAKKPQPGQAESTTRAPVNAEAEEREPPDSIEKQQGSLF